MDYYNWEKNGVRLRNHIEFSEYLDNRMCNTTLKSSSSHGGILSQPTTFGNWGYAYGLLQSSAS